MEGTMSVADQLTLAQLDYELHAGTWPMDRATTETYINIAHSHRVIDRGLLIDILGEYVGRFETNTEFARALTEQSYLADTDVDLTAWPFVNIDWDASASQLEWKVVDDALGTIVRVRGCHYFVPEPTTGGE
jgi:hypothetical protein